MASRAPSGAAQGARPAPAREDGVSPIMGTMFVFVIIVMGMSSAMVFGAPAIKGIQDRATLGDMATQLENVREEAEKLTVEGAGAGVVLAPSQGYVSLQEGTMMAVTISFDSTSQQEGLALAWGKGGRRRNSVDPSKQCDVHFQDWADGDQYVTMQLDTAYCQTPMLWNPSDGSTTTTGTTTSQTLGVDGVVAGPLAGWSTATPSSLGTIDTLYATYANNNPGNDQDLIVSLANPSSRAEAITSVVVMAQVAITGASNDAFLLGACLTETSDQGQPCPQNNDNDFAGPFVHGTDTQISYDITSRHPEGGCWSWADIADLEPVIRLDQTGNRDGTWRVNRVWAEVTSSSLVADACVEGNGNGNGNAGECFDNSANADVACLQGFRMTDSGAVNRVLAIQQTATDSQGVETYLLTLDGLQEGDWYFQLSNDPRNPSLDTLLAKSYLFGMDQLRWVRDEGLSTWLEGGAVFGTRLDTQYVISEPIVDEDFIEASATRCDDIDDATGLAITDPTKLETDDKACQPTYYMRIIRLDGEDASIAANGGVIDAHLEHRSTHSTANDGVSIIRFDFAGEGAELWCTALRSRDAPAGYDYVEHDDFPCDGAEGNDVRSLAYVYYPDCPIPEPNNKWPSDESRFKDNDCIQYQRAQRRYYSVVFAEVHFDVKLRP